MASMGTRAASEEVHDVEDERPEEDVSHAAVEDAVKRERTPAKARMAH